MSQGETGKQENPARVVWELAWPAVSLTSLQVVNNLLDRGFVGHLEPAALTAQSASMNIMFLMFSLAMALATPATAIVSRAYGAGKPDEFRLAYRKCLGVAGIVGIASVAMCLLIAHPTASFLLPKGAARAAVLMGEFLSIYAFSLPAIYLIQTLSSALRGIGDTKSPMVISGIQILLHIGLNFILIFPPRSFANGLSVPGFNMGLNGAAAALSLSTWLAAIAYLAYSGRTALGDAWRPGWPGKEWTARILKIASPAAMMALLRVGSLAAFTKVLGFAPNGQASIAGLGPAFSVESIMFMPSFGLSMAAAALVGQSLGMGKPERAERLGWLASHHAGVVTGVLSLFIFVFAERIAGVMIEGKPQITAEATLLIRYLCVTEVFFAYSLVQLSSMQGAGDTVRPLVISVVSLWGVRVPLAALLALGFGMGSTGAWIAMTVSQALQGVLTMLAFHQGKWKTQKV